jgi:hypothetical protein
MTAQLSSLVDRARQGDGKAIAELINQSLQPQGIVAKVVVRDGVIKVLLEGASVPDEQTMVPFVQQGVAALELPGETLLVMGRTQGSSAPAWSQSIAMRSPVVEAAAENQAATPTIDPVDDPQLAKIIAHLNQTLGTDSITFDASLSDRLLKVMAKTDQLLEGDKFAKLVREQLMTLKLSGIDAVQVYKQKTRGNSCYKLKEFDLVASVAKPETDESESHQSSHSNSHHSSSQSGAARSHPSRVQFDSAPSSSGSSSSGSRSKAQYTIPVLIAVGVATLLFVVSIHFLGKSATAAELCKSSKESPAQCQLAVQLVGSEAIQAFGATSTDFTDEATQQSISGCKDIALRGGSPMRERNSNQTIKSQKTTEVFTGILLSDIETADIKSPRITTGRVACVAHHTPDEAEILAYDKIPTAWPQQAYQPKRSVVMGERMMRTLKVHNNYVKFGSMTLFTAIGLLVVSILNLGIQVYSLSALIQTSAILGTVEALMSMVPGIGFVGGIPLTAVALLITSHFVKDLRIDWASGYQRVASGVIVILAMRMVLNLVLLWVIMSLV